MVCRQLGFSSAHYATKKSHFGPVPSDFAMDDVSCKGTEARLQDCRYDHYDNCESDEGAGVACHP